MKRLALIAIAVLFVAVGCSTKYDLGGASRGTKLDRGQKVCIFTPIDGSHNGKIYAGSGAITAALLQSAIASRAAGVTSLPAQSDIQAALIQAAKGGYRYAFHPQIINWEPRVAAWSGRPTRVNVLMSVYDLRNDRQAVIQQTLDVRGRISTLVSQSPQDILKPLLDQFAEQVF